MTGDKPVKAGQRSTENFTARMRIITMKGRYNAVDISGILTRIETWAGEQKARNEQNLALRAAEHPYTTSTMVPFVSSLKAGAIYKSVAFLHDFIVYPNRVEIVDRSSPLSFFVKPTIEIIPAHLIQSIDRSRFGHVLILHLIDQTERKVVIYGTCRAAADAVRSIL